MAKKIEKGSLQDLQPDPDNPNSGTPEGRGVLETSLRDCAIGRGIVTDKNKRIIGGNKTKEALEEQDVDVVFVHSTGNTMVVTVRDDLDLGADPNTPEYQRARQLSIADNWAGFKGVRLSMGAIQRFVKQGVPVGRYIDSLDLSRLNARLQAPEGKGYEDDSSSSQTPTNNVEPNIKERGSGQGKQDSDDREPEPSEPKPRTQVLKIPLAITIPTDQQLAWEQTKERLGCVRDSAAFEKMWTQWLESNS